MQVSVPTCIFLKIILRNFEIKYNETFSWAFRRVYTR